MDENDQAILQSILTRDTRDDQGYRMVPPPLSRDATSAILSMPSLDMSPEDQQYVLKAEHDDRADVLQETAEGYGRPSPVAPLQSQLVEAMRMVRRPDLAQYGRPNRETLDQRRRAPPPMITKG